MSRAAPDRETDRRARAIVRRVGASRTAHLAAAAALLAACKSPPAAPARPSDAAVATAPDAGPARAEPLRPRRDGPEVLASLVDVRGTGKRHQSYFFTFAVDAVLAGSFAEKQLVSQELYSDFGGQQLLGRAGREPESKRPLALKLVRDEAKPERWVILWSARPEEIEAARQLERAIDALVDAVERRDAARLGAWLAAGSNVDAGVIRRIADAQTEPGHTPFATLADLALLAAHDDVAFVASHARVAYSIELRRDAALGWRIGRFEAR